MATGNAEGEYEAQQEQTDVESLAGTLTSLGNSSITQLPLSCSETEFDFEILGEDLLESQFPPKETKVIVKGQDVQDWLANGEDDTQDVISSDSQTEPDSNQGFSQEEVEKAAAVFFDALKQPFNVTVWTEDDAEQEVPSGDFKSNFMKEVKERPVLTLMNTVKTCCNVADNSSGPGHLYIRILECANIRTDTESQPECSSKERLNNVDMSSLKKFEGGYFDNLKLRFAREVPKSKRPLVRAVEKFVSDEIRKADQGNNPIIFTRYGKIPEILEKCNEEKGLNFVPDKLAKCGITLQSAVHQEIVARCMDFLDHIGFQIMPEIDCGDYKIKLSTNDNLLSQGLSSQGSQQDQPNPADFNHSQNSNIVEGNEDLGYQNIALVEARFAAQYSPEMLRGHQEGDDDANIDNSPGNSQTSWTYDSRSPPQLSLPEREREGGPEPELLHNQDENENDLALDGYVMVNPEFWLQEVNASDGSQQSSYESGEPRRLRPRLE